MKYLNRDRDPAAAEALADAIRACVTGPLAVLDAVGGQVQNLLRSGADRRLPAALELIHGPACPICAAPGAAIEQALQAAGRPGVTVCVPGDLLRVPEGGRSLEEARRRGADIRVVYSALDALAVTRKEPGRTVIYLALGFETTAPAAAAAVLEADRTGLDRFAILNGHLRYIEGVAAALAGPARRARALLASGPVAAVVGLRPFEELAARHGIPVIVTGPEPIDLLEGLRAGVGLARLGGPRLENQYARAVRPDGSPQASAAIDAVFEPIDADWRGLGPIRLGGLALRSRFRRFDAASSLGLSAVDRPPVIASPLGCDAVATGGARPAECPAFATSCTPERPLGAPMASAEGTCAAYHRYRRPPAVVRNPTLPLVATEIQGQAAG